MRKNQKADGAGLRQSPRKAPSFLARRVSRALALLRLRAAARQIAAGKSANRSAPSGRPLRLRLRAALARGVEIALGPASARGYALLLRARLAALDGFRAWLSRLTAAAFRPDVTGAPDPLAPDPAIHADAFAAAARLAAERGSPVNLLLASAPGADFEVRLLSVRSEVQVSVGRSEATRQTPRFSTGAEPSSMRIGGDGDGLRLVLRSTPRGVEVRRWPVIGRRRKGGATARLATR